MGRRQAREMTLQVLFQFDFEGFDSGKALPAVLNERPVDDDDRQYTEWLVQGVLGHMSEIDAKIQTYAKEWTVKRMPGVDRNIMRFAVYEMLFADQPIPVNVVINESVEMAKEYGSEESAKFINGVLGSLARHELNHSTDG